jgi:antitoxin component YwqK of YwqJK toxin-antitoxin module
VIKECEDITIPGYEKAMQQYASGQNSAAKASANRVIEHRWGNGKLETHYQLVNGKIEGKMEEFYENGKPQLTTEYLHGQKNGTENEYFEEGQMKRATIFKDGDSLSETLYYQNGKKQSEWVEVKKVFVRKVIPVSIRAIRTYFDNGRLESEGTLFGEDWDGDFKSYDPSGLVLSYGKYDHGKMVGTWHLNSVSEPKEIEEDFDQGVLVTRRTYQNKKLVRREELMPDGSTKSDQVIKSDPSL